MPALKSYYYGANNNIHNSHANCPAGSTKPGAVLTLPSTEFFLMVVDIRFVLYLCLRAAEKSYTGTFTHSAVWPHSKVTRRETLGPDGLGSSSDSAIYHTWLIAEPLCLGCSTSTLGRELVRTSWSCED